MQKATNEISVSLHLCLIHSATLGRLGMLRYVLPEIWQLWSLFESTYVSCGAYSSFVLGFTITFSARTFLSCSLFFFLSLWGICQHPDWE